MFEKKKKKETLLSFVDPLPVREHIICHMELSPAKTLAHFQQLSEKFYFSH